MCDSHTSNHSRGAVYSKGAPGHSVKAPGVIRNATKRYAEMIDHYDYLGYDLGGTLDIFLSETYLKLMSECKTNLMSD